MSIELAVSKKEAAEGDVPKRFAASLGNALTLVNHMFYHRRKVKVRVQQIECRTGHTAKVVIYCEQELDVRRMGESLYREDVEAAWARNDTTGYCYTFMPTTGNSNEFERLVQMIQAYIHQIPLLQPSPATRIAA